MLIYNIVIPQNLFNLYEIRLNIVRSWTIRIVKGYLGTLARIPVDISLHFTKNIRASIS